MAEGGKSFKNVSETERCLKPTYLLHRRPAWNYAQSQVMSGDTEFPSPNDVRFLTCQVDSQKILKDSYYRAWPQRKGSKKILPLVNCRERYK